MPELTDKFQTLFSSYSGMFTATHHNGNSRNAVLASLSKDVGVYVIFRKADSKCPIYIGSAGKIETGTAGLIYNGSTILKRISGASTPYHLNGSTNEFEYDPTTSGVPPAGYGATIPLADIEFACITKITSCWLAPTVLEHLLIQGFINQFGRLPDVNQKI